MKCPYCKEEIERFSKVCNVCGEHIAPIYSILDLLKEKSPNIIKWFKISAVSIIAFVLLITGIIFTVKIISENRLTDNGYKSIQLTYTPEGSLHDAFSVISQQEQDLIKFLTKSKNPEDNSRLFGIFMDNLEKARQYFFDNYNYDKSLSEQGLITTTKISGANQNLVKITSPDLNVFKAGKRGAIGLMIDYDYIITTFCPYLTEDWKEYLGNNELQSIANQADGMKNLVEWMKAIANYDGNNSFAKAAKTVVEKYLNDFSKWSYSGEQVVSMVNAVNAENK